MDNIIMKKKLIDSLKALPMTMEDKEKFAEVVCSKTSSGGSNSIFKWRYYDGQKFTSIVGDFYQALLNYEFIARGVIVNKFNIAGSNILVPLADVIIEGSGGAQPMGLMILDPMMMFLGVSDLYKVIEEICKEFDINYENLISALEAAEITEEEFMKDVVIE